MRNSAANETEKAARYLADHQLAKRFGVERTTIWRWVKLGLLGAPVKLGPNTTRWKLEDVEAFEARQAAASGQAA